MLHSGNYFCGTVKLEVTGSPGAVDLATTVAFAMTGTRWSGPRFFGLRRAEKRT
jgi:hypothetical protein